MQRRPFVMVFCKYPRPGTVKTRLAARLGQARACALYSAFVSDVLAALDAAGAEVELHAAPDRELHDYSRWLGSRHNFQLQQGSDLGQRMKNAFARVFAQGRKCALLLGTDVPQLPPWHVKLAWKELAANSLVLGPALDGGYYLMGLRSDSFDPRLFQAVSWSSRHVLGQTIARLKPGRRLALLPALRDCDNARDLGEILETATPGSSRHTTRAARAMGLM